MVGPFRRTQIPVFPLPSTVLFPDVFVPLHIFEDRYKKMLAHVETTGCHLALSWAPETEPGVGFPQKVCGAGPVKILKKHPNGELDIVVIGAYRVRFDRYVQELPFLIGDGEILTSQQDMPSSTEKQLLTDIREMVIQWLFMKYAHPEKAISHFQNVQSLEPLVNFVGFYFISDIHKKQDFLVEDSLEVRAQMVWQILKDSHNLNLDDTLGQILDFPKKTKKRGPGEIN